MSQKLKMPGYSGITYSAGRRASERGEASGLQLSSATSGSASAGGKPLSEWEKTERTLLTSLLHAQTEVIEKFHSELQASEKERAKLAQDAVTLNSRLERMNRRSTVTGVRHGHTNSDSELATSPPAGGMKRRRLSGTLPPQQRAANGKHPSELASSATNSARRPQSPFGSVTGKINEQSDIVPIPGWSKAEDEPPQSSKQLLGKSRIRKEKEIAEDLNEDIFNRRHDKLQVDEQRMKKRDAQRVRELERHRKLAERGGRKSSYPTLSRPSSAAGNSDDETDGKKPMKINPHEIAEIFVGNEMNYELREGNVLKKIGRGRPHRHN